MEKEFIPYEQALELKELGFNIPCYAYYDCERDLKLIPNKNKFLSCEYVAPLYQQVFRWFREKYQLSSWIYTSYDEKFYYSILKDKRFMISEFYTVTKIKIPNKIYNTYEESELACLNKLIRIVKKYYDNGRTI